MNILVVTSPDSASAQAAQQGPLKQFESLSKPFFHKIISTHDPYNARCGSGGGTLAALMLALASTEEQNPNPTILIVHAGGDSSRCPTQMVLGKSWTTLPCSPPFHTPGMVRQVELQTPTFFMVQKLQDTLLRCLPQGSVVVAASDTLLHLPLHEETTDWSSLFIPNPNQDTAFAVMGIAVPAPLDIAKNHGVYVVSSSSQTSQALPTICPVYEVLQKPSVEEMEKHCAIFLHPNTQQQCAWIDTGIVVFLPRAVTALQQLAQEELSCCCWDGLRDLWHSSKNSSFLDGTGITAHEALEDFALLNTFRVDLYTHLLMAFATKKSKPQTLSAYLERHMDLPQQVLKAIYKKLSLLELQALLVPKGEFLHLGTSLELVQFFVEGTANFDNSGEDDFIFAPSQTLRSRRIAKEMGLVREYQSLCLPPPTVRTKWIANEKESHHHFCLYNSLIQTTGKVSIGSGCVLEHVHVQHASVDISIGYGCLISGLRIDLASSQSSARLDIPDKTCLQVLPLVQDQKYVVIMFGIDDDIKSWRQVHRVNSDVFLQATCIDDLWEPGEEKLLWTAKLHPVVTEIDLPKILGWIQELRDTSTIQRCNSSLRYFKEQRRLSLEQIRRLSDASREWEYRYELERVVIPLHINFLKRQHIECHLTLSEKSIATIADIANKAMATGMLDVCGRAFMVASDLLANHECRSFEAVELPQALTDILNVLLNNPFERLKSCKALFDECKKCVIHNLDLTKASQALEQAASILTELCVRGSTLPTFERKTPPVLEQWVIASAPARVDLSGGWSDTPPICFEYGGAVAGLAVIVNDMKPISCRCRIIPGGEFVKLRTESRHAVTAQLQSQTTSLLSKRSDLLDYRDPLADCALIKCTLVYLGLVSNASGGSDDLQPLLKLFCGVKCNVGLEIVSTSLLPTGSGLGTSSILAGCILASLARCIGVILEEKDDGYLIALILQLEQMLTCGGGWQDQIGGLIGGLKLGRSSPQEYPVRAKVQRVSLRPATMDKLNERLILVFCGQTRLAKGLLQKVLRRWSRRTLEVVNTVEALVQDAHGAIAALVDDDFDALADCLNRYWSLKKAMAGSDSGVEPEIVRLVLAELLQRRQIVAGSLCGAGGGGFMVLLASEGKTMNDVKRSFEQEVQHLHKDASGLAWYSCRVSMEGLTTQILSRDDIEFNTAWLKEQ